MLRIIRYLWCPITLVLSLTLLACSLHPPENKNAAKVTIENEVFRIGLVADSQFQSENSTLFRPVWRSHFGDHVVDVALRPPAQNLLAEDMLNELLRETIKTGDVDMLLYLGDGANNGCFDELTRIFKVLQDFRKNKQIPIFYVIGNHDYLGAGNTSNVEHRNGLCSNQNTPAGDSLHDNTASKFQVIKMIHEFNKVSAGLLPSETFRFQDSVGDRLEQQCGSREDAQHFQPGCYYAAYIESKDLEIFLTDSSNYGERATWRALGWEFSGIFGTICCADDAGGQWQWFNRIRDNRIKPKWSIFASHYPPDKLLMFQRPAGHGGNRNAARKTNQKIDIHNNRVAPFFDIFEGPRPQKLLWLSGHTHTPAFSHGRSATVAKYSYVDIRGGSALPRKKATIEFTGFNVGSTTDYRQHTAVVRLSDKHAQADEIRLLQDKQINDCVKLEKRIHYGDFEIGDIAEINGRESGVSIFGLTKDYRNWHQADFGRARENFDRLKQALEEPEHLKCLAHIAARNEHQGNYSN